MKILIDASGGDNAPSAPILGGLMAKKEFDVDIVFVGNPEKIKEIAGADVEIIESTDDITNEDKALSAIKKKPNSSMVLGLKMLCDKQADAFVSAGNTGALVSAATLFAKRLPGVKRPALAPILPTGKGMAMLADAGANLECKPEFLYQFGVMGAVYMKNVHGVIKPKVGLLNVGSEEGKGVENIQAAYELLNKENRIYDFAGNVEARDFVCGACDVLVSEGFAGNVLLKSVEGMGIFAKNMLKDAVYANLISKIGGLFLKSSFKRIFSRVDYTRYGGAPLLGVNGTVIKAHGSSNDVAFFNAIRQAKDFTETGVNSWILDELA